MLAFTFSDPRMVLWHNHLAEHRQAGGGGFQHFIAAAPGFSEPAGVPLSADDVAPSFGFPGAPRALIKAAAAGQVYAQ